METQITRKMRQGFPSNHPKMCGPSLENRKPYRTKALKTEARAQAFTPNKGKFRGTNLSYVKTLIHGAPKVREDLSG